MNSIGSAITVIGLVWATAVGLLYFFSRDFRARKKREWRREGRLTAMTEWAEWVFSIVVVLIVLVAVIAAYIGFYQRTY